jgi:hypothetical protein
MRAKVVVVEEPHVKGRNATERLQGDAVHESIIQLVAEAEEGLEE